MPMQQFNSPQYEVQSPNSVDGSIRNNTDAHSLVEGTKVDNVKDGFEDMAQKIIQYEANKIIEEACTNVLKGI